MSYEEEHKKAVETLLETLGINFSKVNCKKYLTFSSLIFDNEEVFEEIRKNGHLKNVLELGMLQEGKKRIFIFIE